MKIMEPEPQYLSSSIPLAARPATLDGAIVGLVDGWGWRGMDGSIAMYPMMASLLELMQRRFQISHSIWIKKAKANSPPEPDEMQRLTSTCTAAVIGICRSGGATAGAVTDAVNLESAGVPTITLCHTEYETIAQRLAKSLGMPHLPLLVYPEVERDEDIDRQASAGISDVIRALTSGWQA